ncbi:RNA chaperone Hfq [Bacillus sp. CGMCC 1.60114]|uniref:RNA chaperone Hfq n=1 Tax=unclassified Bacillus (in: firmicutes) TaxID=185979 RepID=UPI003625D36B
MHLFFDTILKHLEHFEIKCTIILRDSKSIKDCKIIGREKYMIYIETEEKQHLLFKSNIIDIIPSQKLDLHQIRENTRKHKKDIQLEHAK